MSETFLTETLPYYINAIANVLHLLAAVIWIGGMFFAYLALRPAAAQLEPAQRLQLWTNTFKHFFPWVFASVIILLASGMWLIIFYKAGFAGLPMPINIMMGLGIIMMLIFFHVYFAPYKRLKNAVQQADWEAGNRSLAQIRKLIGINLLIGLTIIIVVGLGSML